MCNIFSLFKRSVKRTAKISRKTKETEIDCSLTIDGKGEADINTGIGFLDHMLELLVFHGLFDLKLKAKGDLKVDIHHTNEDIGIVLGQAFKKALGNMRSIKRFGFFSVPMEDVQSDVTVDISGRSHFTGIKTNFNKAIAQARENYAWNDADHFFESFAKQGGINLIINVEVGDTDSSKALPNDIHTVLEPVFKALGKALDQATSIDPRRKGIPSTKGVID